MAQHCTCVGISGTEHAPGCPLREMTDFVDAQRRMRALAAIAPFVNAEEEAAAIINAGIPSLPQAIISYCELASQLSKAESAGLRHLRPLEVHTGKVIALLSRALEQQLGL